MSASCDLRWMHGPVVLVAEGDGETQCLKVRSDDVLDGPSLRAKERQGYAVYPALEAGHDDPHPVTILVCRHPQAQEADGPALSLSIGRGASTSCDRRQDSQSSRLKGRDGRRSLTNAIIYVLTRLFDPTLPSPDCALSDPNRPS